jgi:hypothetical protein
MVTPFDVCMLAARLHVIECHDRERPAIAGGRTIGIEHHLRAARAVRLEAQIEVTDRVRSEYPLALNSGRRSSTSLPLTKSVMCLPFHDRCWKR